MAERRMFSKAIVESDVFLDLNLSAQALYLHLSLNADNEGFVGNPKRVQRLIGASEDDLKALLDRRYILQFDSGVIVIKHWYINNYIRGDRKGGTTYTEEKSLLKLDSKNAYTEADKKTPKDNQLTDICQTDDSQVADICQHRVDKSRVDKISKEENMKEEKSHTHNDFISSSIPTLQEVKDFFILKGININPERFYNYYSSLGWKKGNTPIENWQLLALEWHRKELTESRMKNGFKERKATANFGEIEVSDEDI